MSNYRMIRIGLLIAVVVGGILFHHHGHGYEVMRGVYFVIIIGFLVWRLAMRTGGRSPRRRNRTRTQAPYNSGPYNSPPPPSPSDGPPAPGSPSQDV